MTQTGDRELVLARLRAGTSAPPPRNHAHAAPAPNPVAPSPRSHLLDDDADPTEVFVRTATAAGCTLHRELDLAAVVAAVVAAHDVRAAVVTDEPVLAELVELLGARGITVGDAADRGAAAAADLGVTSCRAAIASTGSVVIGSDVPGARWASLLPRVHLCLVDAAAIVGHVGDVLRPLDAEPLPANLWLVTGPSRTGDIEQLLTRGVHGPVAVEVVLMNGR